MLVRAQPPEPNNPPPPPSNPRTEATPAAVGKGFGQALIMELLGVYKAVYFTTDKERRSISSDALKMVARMDALGYEVSPVKDLLIEGNRLGKINLI